MCVCDHWSHTSNKGDTKAKNEDWEDENGDFLVHLRKKSTYQPLLTTTSCSKKRPDPEKRAVEKKSVRLVVFLKWWARRDPNGNQRSRLKKGEKQVQSER